MLKRKNGIQVQILYIVFITGRLLAFAPFVSSIPTSTDKNKVNVCDSPECQLAANNLKNSIDTYTDPCDDFYQYACGKWPKVHRTPTILLPSSTVQLRSNANEKEILDFLKKPNSENEPKAVHKARKLFSLCLDEKTVFKNEITPIKDILSQVGLSHVPPFGNSSKKDFDYIAATIKALKIVGVKQFFDIGVEANPYNQTVNVIGLTKPALQMDPGSLPLYQNLVINKALESVSQEGYLQQAMITMCENNTAFICGILSSPVQMAFLSRMQLSELLEYESLRTQIIAKARPKMNSTATYTMYSLQELQNRTDIIAENVFPTIPKFNWTRCIELLFSDVENVTIDLRDPSKVEIAVYEIDFIEEMIKFIYSSTLEKHEFGLWWSIVSKLLPYIDSKMSEMKNKVLGELSEPKTREETCTGIVSSTLGMATSYYYTTMSQYNKTKVEVYEMVENIKESLKDLIEQSVWMDKNTKEKSFLKIKSLKSLVAYPDSIRNSQNLDDFYKYIEVSDDFLGTIISKVQQYTKRQLSKYNQLNDPNEDRWIITPNMVNAFYEPSKNTITIPAGILGIPVYCNSLKALDYGAVGSIVGHEISHGFDNAGRRYNSIGNVEDWWKSETLEAYRKKAKCFIEAYDNYGTNFNRVSQKVDSKSTFGENIADNGGFKEALFAYRKYVSKNGVEPFLTQFENYTQEQLFTLGFANMWCEHPTILQSLLAEYMDHSPNAVRVNGVLKNSEEFSNIWKCPKGSNMNPVNEKCSIW